MDARLIVAREALIDEVDLSADGELVVYGRRTTAPSGDANLRRLWTVPWSGGRPRPLTSGRHLDHTPRIAPDGASVAFLSNRETDADQVWVVPVGGGEPRRLTSFQRGATALAWSPDGRWLAVCAHDDTSHLHVGERPKGEPTARVIERLDWRDDDTYGLLAWPVHVHRVPLRGRSQQLTSGPWFAASPGFLPDGRVGFVADPRPGADRAPLPQLHAVAAPGDEPEPVSSLPGPVLDWTSTATRSCASRTACPIRPTQIRPWSCACPTVPSSAATATHSPSTSRARPTSCTAMRARPSALSDGRTLATFAGPIRSPPPAAASRPSRPGRPAPATSTRSSRIALRGG